MILRSSLLVVFLVAPDPVFCTWVPSRVHCSQQFLTAHSERSTWPATRRVDQPAVFIPMIRPLLNSLNCEKCVLARLPDMFRLPKSSYNRGSVLYERNPQTATHIGIREAEDWFRPIDLAKECDIYISSRSGSHKEIPITYGYTQDPFKNKSQNFKTKIKENYPQYHERENKNCFICGDSSHYARDCEKRFRPKESNDHIHNKINVNTLKIESEKQNSEECANLQYVNIFVENQPVTALIDSGCQIPVLNSSLIRVQTPSEEIITLSSCFGEQRMVEVKPINISLNQHSPGLSVRMAISPTLTEEFIIHPSIYSEIEKLGHAKSDVLLSESESSLGAHAYAYSSGVSFPNVSVSNVIKNSSYDLPYVKNFNTGNDSSSLIKDYKCEHRRFVLLRKIFQPWQWKRRKKRNRFEQTSRTLQRKISMRSTKDQLVEKDVLMPVKNNVFLWNLPDVEEVPSHDGETILLLSPWKYRCGQRTVRMAVVACSQNQAVFERRRIKVKAELKLKKQRLLRKNLELEQKLERKENARGWSNRRIGRHLGRSDMVVARCWQQWITEDRVYRRGGQDVPGTQMIARIVQSEEWPLRHQQRR
ncbi:uncharacterized protein TNCV_780161 [Trichonephila clavipes]|nr:uncharacterized protein TNCV_780161 [Trichonephila clavipes]